jgi:K+-transporting ATPase A subunit
MEIERLIYRATGLDETREMRWTRYAVNALLLNLALDDHYSSAKR